MAEWKYLIETASLQTGELDSRLPELLRDYGDRGWELVQVLPPAGDGTYRLIFKTEKAFTDVARAEA